MSHKIKQLQHLLKTRRIFAWSRYLKKLVSVGATRRFIFSFFANQNFRRHRKAELLRKWIANSTSSEISFHGLPSNSKHPSIRKQIALSLSSQLIVLVLHIYIFSPSMYNHTTSSKLYCRYLQNLQRWHAKYPQSAKTTELKLRNTAKKALDKNTMLALSPEPNTFFC